MMSAFLHAGAADRALEFLLVVILAVGLASSAAWFISRRWRSNPALRHLVLFSALVSCLASPAAAWLCAEAGIAVLSVPILSGEQNQTAAGVTELNGDPQYIAPCQTAVSSAAASESSALTSTTAGLRAAAAVTGAADRDSRAAALAFVTGCESNIPAAEDRSDVAIITSAAEPPAHRSAEGPADHAGAPGSIRRIVAGAMFAWAAGALLMLVRLALSCRRVVQLRRQSHPVEDGRLHALLSEVAGRLAMRRIPLLLVSSRAVTPLAVGLGRPAVILPERLLRSISEDELRDILMHEVAHLRRGDQRIMLLQELAAALYWPIVSVHALNRELQRAREELCDNVVLAARDPITYGETLLHIAELLVGNRRMGAAIGFIGGQGELERRITRLIDPGRNRMTRTGHKLTCAVMLLFGTVVGVLSATRFANPATTAEPPTVAATEDAPPDPQATPALIAELTTLRCPEPGGGKEDAPAADAPPADVEPENPQTDPVKARAEVTQRFSRQLRFTSLYARKARTYDYLGSFGGLVENRSWKEKLSLADAQTKALSKLDDLLMDAHYKSFSDDADYLDRNPADYREYLDRSDARRDDALEHARSMVVLGLLTGEQAASVIQRRLSSRQQIFNSVRYREYVQELLGITEGQLDLLNQVGANARKQRARLNWFSADPQEGKTVTEESTRIEHQSFAALQQILTPRQQQTLQQLTAERTLPAEPPDVPALSDAAAERIDIEDLSPTFRALAEQAEVLGLSADQKKWLAELKDVVRVGLLLISLEKREGPYLLGDPRNDKSDPVGQIRTKFLQHAEQAALLGILTQQQAARLIVPL